MAKEEHEALKATVQSSEAAAAAQGELKQS